ncbi:MAG: hypothetical protein ABDH21_06395 [bacterium]
MIYKVFAFCCLIISFMISIVLWNLNYLGLKSQYEQDMKFYDILVTSLGNVRYTLAAYLWIRTEFYIHYSGHIAINQLPEIVYYTRFITILDPNFVEAYDFGTYQLAFFLDKPREGLDFLKEGIKNNPDYWKLYYTAGLIYSQKFRDYKKAMDNFLKAEELIFSPITQKKYSDYKIDPMEYGRLYRFISKCFYEQREYSKALEYYNKSLNYINVKSNLYYEILRQLYGR